MLETIKPAKAVLKSQLSACQDNCSVTALMNLWSATNVAVVYSRIRIKILIGKQDIVGDEPSGKLKCDFDVSFRKEIKVEFQFQLRP